MGACHRSSRISGLALAGPLLALIAITAWLGLLTPRSAEALDGEEQAFLVMLNDHRAQNGFAPLASNDTLNNVARWMANDMGTNNYFSHTDSLVRDPFQRMDQMGYAYNTWRGENLVAGTETAAAAFDLWKNSPGHNANMLGANYTVIGIARVYIAGSDYGWYWATEFGGYPSAPPPPPPPPAPTPPPPPVVITPAPVPVSPPPAPTVVVTEAPTPSPTPKPEYENTDWWRSLEQITDDWGTKIFALELLRVSPALEELFITLIRSG